MARISIPSLIAGGLVLCVTLFGGFSLLPRETREQALATFRIQPTQTVEAVALAATTPTITPTLTPTSIPTNTPTPTSTPTPTPIPTDGPPVGELGASIDRYLNSLVDRQLFHGAVLVARGGNVMLSKGYGPADIDRGIPNSANTRLRLASMTKSFTSAAIMQLAAKGALNIDDPVCKYIADCPDTWSKITIRHLLTHTHGLPNYTDFPSYEKTQMNPTTVEQLVDRLRGQWPVFPAGSAYAYGNSGYVLLGAIIEKVSGMSYGDYLHQHIFAPLHMDNSGVTYNPGPGNNWALPYQGYSNLAPKLDTSTLYSAGAVYSTVEDLYRWDQALYSDEVVPDPQRQEMFTPVLNRYGFGWKIVDVNGHLRYSHPGEMDGCRTIILRFPNERVTVIVLANMHDANSDAIANYIAQLVFDS